jgi:hypothetical protein
MEHNISLKSTVNFKQQKGHVTIHMGSMVLKRNPFHKPIGRVTLFDQVSSLRSQLERWNNGILEYWVFFTRLLSSQPERVMTLTVARQGISELKF